MSFREKNVWIYSHHSFHRDKPELLDGLFRRTNHKVSKLKKSMQSSDNCKEKETLTYIPLIDSKGKRSYQAVACKDFNVSSESEVNDSLTSEVAGSGDVISHKMAKIDDKNELCNGIVTRDSDIKILSDASCPMRQRSANINSSNESNRLMTPNTGATLAILDILIPY